jgi:hypothetical protein
MPDIVDPEFGPVELRRGSWRGTVHVPALGGEIPFEFDTLHRRPPNEAQRACLSDFVNRCDEVFLRHIEREIFDPTAAPGTGRIWPRERGPRNDRPAS